MLKPLIIDYDYKLLNSASGQIARNFWEQQVDNGFNPIIVCSPANFDFDGKVTTIEVRDRKWFHYIGSALKKIGQPGLALMPDMFKYSWARYVKKYVKGLEFDYIHTLSSPQSTHLAGLALKRKTGKPWVAQFNDPWTDSAGRRNHKPNFSKSIDAYYEKQVVENADLIIHTNSVIADIWTERYGDSIKEKMAVVPLNFNIKELPSINPVIQDKYDGKLNISHIGEIYGSRSCADLLRGVVMLVEKHSELRDMIHITFVGRIKKEEATLPKELGISELVEIIPPLPPEKLDKYYSSSDIFFAADVKSPRSPSFPSKLMMYYYYRKPILGITNPNSIMELELNRTGNTVCYYGHPEQICEYLYRAITDYKCLNTFDQSYWQNYTVENVSNLYKSLLLKILKK